MDNGLTYGQQLLRTYEVMYGEFDTSSYEAGEIFFFIVITVLLSVIMLNMIIAMMSDTFGRVQSKRVLFESKEKCLLIMEVFSVQRMLRRVFCAKRLKRMDKAAPQYLFVIEENIDENNELDTKMEVELACVQKKIEKSFGIQKQMEEKQKSIEQQLFAMREDFGQLKEMMLALLEKSSDGRVPYEGEMNPVQLQKNLPR